MNNQTPNSQGFIGNTADHLIAAVMGGLPHFPLFDRIKSALMRTRGARIGRGVKYFQGVWIDHFPTVDIGSDVSVGKDAILIASGGITIGKRSMIGHRTIILSVNHVVPPGRKAMRFAGAESKPVFIANDVWIGAGVTILPGITIGEGAIIGASSVVTKNVPPYAVAVGSPARVIKKRG